MNGGEGRLNLPTGFICHCPKWWGTLPAAVLHKPKDSSGDLYLSKLEESDCVQHYKGLEKCLLPAKTTLFKDTQDSGSSSAGSVGVKKDPQNDVLRTFPSSCSADYKKSDSLIMH